MCIVHPLFRQVPQVVADLAATRQPFAVEIRGVGVQETLNVMAFTPFDAITMAIDLFFDGSYPMPTAGLDVSARPMGGLPCAA